MDRLSESDWFDAYQPTLVWWANTRTGRDALGIGYDWPRLVRVTPESIHARLTGRECVAEFRTRKLYLERIQSRFPEWLAALRYYDRRTAETEAYWQLPLRTAASSKTFYPDADAETNSVDGEVMHSPGGDRTWATLVAGGGTAADDNNSSSYVDFKSTTTSDRWARIRRAIFLFYTISLNGSKITAGTLNLWCSAKFDNLSVTPDLNIYSSNPASDTQLAAGDYDSCGTTEFSSAKSYASVSTSKVNAYTLNAAGLAAISKSGCTKLSARNANYDVADSAPSWSSLQDSGFRIYCREYVIAAQHPNLVVTYIPPSTLMFGGVF